MAFDVAATERQITIAMNGRAPYKYQQKGRGRTVGVSVVVARADVSFF